ncbi:MAG: hypothetical protein GY810_18035 [Aureispira sp.]|nr:hypothetical protein [Aureispira sp.]
MSLSFLGLVSYNNPKEEYSDFDKQQDNTFVKVTAPEIQTDSLSIPLNGFNIVLNDFSGWIDSQEDDSNSDTIELSMDLIQDFNDIQFRILNMDEFDYITVQQFHENSISISAEGPHCDLTDWKHFTSKPITSNYLGNQLFKTKAYDYKNLKKFPQYTQKELYKAIENRCGKDWAEATKTIDDNKGLYLGVSISRLFIQIEGRETKTQKMIKKLIVINVPMGC